MEKTSQNICILKCNIVHKSFARCEKFQIKTILEKFEFVNEFKICVVCLKYEKNCRCVFSVIKNQFRGKNCKHCHQRHHYLLCQTPVGLLHSEKIRKRFLGLTKKRRKGKRQKNNFPEQFVNGKFVFTTTKPKSALYMEELYGYGTALGVKQPNSPLGVYAHGRVCEVNPESNQGQPTSPRDPPTTPKWTEPRLWQGCACQDIECDSLYPACPFGEFDVDVDLNQPTPARDQPTTPEWTEPRLWQGCACQDIECDSLYPACPFGEFDVDVD